MGKFCRHLDLRVKVPDALLCLLSHPLAVVPHVVGQPLRAAPFPGEQRLLLAGLGVDGMLARKIGRDLDHRLGDHHRYRVEVAGVTLQPKSLCLQGSEPPPAKGSWKAGSLWRSNSSLARGWSAFSAQV